MNKKSSSLYCHATVRRVTAGLLFVCLSFVLVKPSPAPPILPAGPKSFQVTTVAYSPTSCSVTSGDLTFPGYNYLTGASQSSTAAVTVNCTTGRGYSLYPDNGQNASGSRRMVYNSSNFLSYALYKDSGHTQEWDTIPANQFSGTGSGSAQNFTIYGYLPASQTVPDGVFQDTVTMIVEYTP